MGQIVKTIESMHLTSYDSKHKQERALPPNGARTHLLQQNLASDFTSLVQDAFFKQTFKSPLGSSSPEVRINITLRKDMITVTNKTTGEKRQFAINHNQEMALTNQIISRIFSKALAALKTGPAPHQPQPAPSPIPQRHSASPAPIDAVKNPYKIKKGPLAGLSIPRTTPQPTPRISTKNRPPAISIPPRKESIAANHRPHTPSTPFSTRSIGKLFNSHSALLSESPDSPLFSKASASRIPATRAQSPIKKDLSPLVIPSLNAKEKTPTVSKSSQNKSVKEFISKPSAAQHFRRSPTRPLDQDEFPTTYTAYPSLFSKDSYYPKQSHLPLNAKKNPEDVFDIFALRDSPLLSNSQELDSHEIYESNSPLTPHSTFSDTIDLSSEEEEIDLLTPKTQTPHPILVLRALDDN